MQIIDRILDLIKEKNITANRLLVECKLNSSSINDWKKGKGKPSADALIKIADYLNVSIDSLCGRDTIQTSSIPSNIQKLWSSLNSLQQIKAEGFMKGMLERENEVKETL